MFFTDQFDNHPWEAPPDISIKTPAWPPRRRNLSCQEEGRGAQGAGAGEQVEARDPAATLQAMAGEITHTGKHQDVRNKTDNVTAPTFNYHTTSQ